MQGVEGSAQPGSGDAVKRKDPPEATGIKPPIIRHASRGD